MLAQGSNKYKVQDFMIPEDHESIMARKCRVLVCRCLLNKLEVGGGYNMYMFLT